MTRLPILGSIKRCFSLEANASQKGQVLVVLVLTLAVILTVVLSVASRSVTEVTVTSFEENALRAFSAAEAGVEQVLLNPKIDEPISGNPDPGVSFTTTVKDPYLSENRFRYPKDLLPGETATFWLVSHDDASGRLICSPPDEPCFRGNNLSICWGNPNAPPESEPAVEILFFYDSTTQAVDDPNNFKNVQIAKFAVDPVSRGNNFEQAQPADGNCDFNGDNIDDLSYRRQIVINDDIEPGCQQPGCPLLVKVRMYYNSEPHGLGIIAGPVGGSENVLPNQGLQITSTGTAGESTRRVSVFQGYPEPPALFDAAVFSKTGIVKL